MEYKLRIPESQLRAYQLKYDVDAEKRLDKYKSIAKMQGYLTVAQLYEICAWKSRRRAALSKTNPPPFVKEITRFAFSAKSERSRLGALTLLEGVHFPTGSVILHFCVDQTYPILDVRALWSLSIAKPSQYSFTFWEDYVEICRQVARKNKLSVRELDMALWQYSREHQQGLAAAS